MTPPGADPASSDHPSFDIVLRPHRSLSPVGFAVIMSILAIWSFIGGLVFWLKGAWPVIGFLGIDIALVYWAFRASYGQGRAAERLRLAEGTLTVWRMDKRGAEERVAFPSYWLRVTLEEDQNGPGQLFLSSHGRHLAVGAFLAPDERAELARELSAALRQARAAPVGSF
ncbi:MAG: DUF2244 domain-containing protein [Alphaproteobacteria bacterium]|nr:DUF2244 domain-containing protein [Alphaproteobacteria bacterium]